MYSIIKKARLEAEEISSDDEVYLTSAEPQPIFHNKIKEEYSEVKPIYVLGEWENHSWDKRVSVAVLVPSVIGKNPSAYNVQVSPDGKTLFVTVVWPKGMTDPDVLYRVWTEATLDSVNAEGTARAAEFRLIMRSLRSNSAQNITSTCSIEIPKPVKTNCDLEKNGNIQAIHVTATGERILCITLEAPDTGYKVAQSSCVRYASV